MTPADAEVVIMPIVTKISRSRDWIPLFEEAARQGIDGKESISIFIGDNTDDKRSSSMPYLEYLSMVEEWVSARLEKSIKAGRKLTKTRRSIARIDTVDAKKNCREGL